MVAVPTHFFKVVMAETAGKSADGGASREVVIGAFVMPNAPLQPHLPLTAFVVPIEALEEAAGVFLIFTLKLEYIYIQLRHKACAVRVKSRHTLDRSRQNGMLTRQTSVEAYSLSAFCTGVLCELYMGSSS